MSTIAYIPIRSLFCTLVLWTAIGNTQPANSTLRHFPERVESALSRAGTNGAELVRFLEKTPESQKDAGQFLLANMPQPDLQSLSAAFLLENLSLAHEAMTQAPWSKNIPHDIFLNDVLPYASLTEQRDNWRKRLYEIAHPIVKGAQTPSEAAQALNQKMFTLLNVRYSTTRRAPDQGPFETMRSGVATCTGLSILLVDACRSVGVPARLAGSALDE